MIFQKSVMRNLFQNRAGFKKALPRLAVLVAVLLIWQFCFPERLLSQTMPDLQDRYPMDQSLWGTGRRVLDYQFDRADRELSPGRWMEEARRGILNTRAVLAEMVPEIFLEAGTGDEFMEWSEKELENRFTRWLLERFFGAGIETQTAGVFRDAGEADKYFIYQTGQDRNILYDPRTGDPLVIRPGDEGHDFSDDLQSWRKITQDAAGREVLDYHSAIKELYPELLIYISPGREEEFERILAEAGNNTAFSLNHEFEAILAREERYFTAQRLGDVWSSRKKSEDKSAGAIGAQLVEEALRVCNDGIAAIEAKIEAAKGEEGDFALAGTQWLEEFREQFNRGLKAWEDAEERFLVRRIEWEVSAEKAFNEGRETWNAAFTRFEEERRLWEEKARELFLEGERFFAQASDTLESAISAAKYQFERDSKLMIDTASERAAILVSMYVINGSVAEEARKTLDYWIAEYRKHQPDVAVPEEYADLQPWIDEELIRLGTLITSTTPVNGSIRITSSLFETIREALGSDRQASTQQAPAVKVSYELEKLILNELKIWLELYRNYMAKEEESRAVLMKELYSSMDNWVDSYDTELIRLEAELEYWKNRTVIAGAVAAYAEALDAGRITAAESAEAWERARLAYDEAVALYGEAEASLMAGSAEISAARGAMVEAAGKMKAAEAVIEKLSQNYKQLSYALGKQGKSIVEADLLNLCRNLGAEQELLGTFDESSPWGKFLACAQELEKEQFKEFRMEILKQLIAGDGELMVSLSALALKAEDGASSEDDSLFRLAEIMKEGIIYSEEQQNLIAALLNDRYRSHAENEFDLRLAALSLILEKDSVAEWYFSVNEDRNEDSSGFEINNEEAQLLSDWEYDTLDLLLARVRLELGVLDFLEDKGTGETEALLALMYTGDETKMSLDRKALERIVVLLYDFIEKSSNNYFPGDLFDYLTVISKEDERILYFIAGNSLINPQFGTELVQAILKEQVRKEEYSGGLYNIYSGLGDTSPVVARENIERRFRQLEKLWETLGIETNNSIFPATETILLSLKKNGNDIDTGISSLFFILDDIFSGLPSWLELSFNLWKQSLAEYCVSPGSNTFVMAERHKEILNNSFLLLKGREYSGLTDDFDREISRYLADPSLDWDDTVPKTTAVSNDYESAFGELENHYTLERYLVTEIERFLALLESSGEDPAEAELDKLLAEKTLAEEKYDILAAAYQEAADYFRNAGLAYDNLYAETEKAYKEFEDARKAFETQDAIRLWAETAYLDYRKPIDDLKLCKEKVSRVLEVIALINSLDRDDSQTGEYWDTYKQYEESLSLYTLSLEAMYKLENTVRDELDKNNIAYEAYQEQLNTFGISHQQQLAIFKNILQYGGAYISPEDKSLWTIADMITIDDDGFLLFSRNDEYVLKNTDEKRSADLMEYFDQNIIIGNETYMISSFELALRELENNITALNLSRDKYIQLGLARDYLIKSILDNNPGLGGTEGWYKTADALGADYNLGQMSILDGQKIYYKRNYYSDYADFYRREAWNSLDGETKRYLEFYTILTLLGGGGKYSEYFSAMTEYYEYSAAYNVVESRYQSTREKANRFLIGWIWNGDLNEIKYTRSVLTVPFNEKSGNISKGFLNLKETINTLDQKLAAYQDSSEQLVILKGGKNDNICWEDIERSIDLIERFSGDLQPLKELWEKINKEYDISVQDVYEAIKLLAEESGKIKEESTLYLSREWKSCEDEKKNYGASYIGLYNSFLEGKIDLKDLREAAALCFGKNVPSGKEHLENTGIAIIENLREFTDRGLAGTQEYSSLAQEYSRIISEAWADKYSAELIVRENEWNLRRRDIGEKLSLWRESAAVILEQGRMAWKEGEEKLREACNMWVKTFREEYAGINDQWTAAYIEGLRDKEAWAAAALDAAGEASSAAAMALVGSGAEAAGRAMDTRDPFDFLNLPDMREADRILAELLEKSGIGNLTSAFGSIMNSRESFASAVRTGIPGADLWKSGAALTEASVLARTVREELEARESRKLAYTVMNTAREAFVALEKSLVLANDGFRKNMDETFIISGQWQRSGSGYRKKVVVNSTLFSRVITDTAVMEGYRNFLMPETRLSASVYEEIPQNLNILKAEALVDSVYSEIIELSKRIFGDGGSEKGEFPVHIGTPAIMKPSPNADKGYDGVLESRGTGELGRLLSGFYYWSCRERKGIALMDVAPWDKPLWDSYADGSSIGAPSLRGAVSIAASAVVAIVGTPFSGGASIPAGIALGAALYSASDLVFAVLDVTGGYKSWSEAGVEFGKSLLMNTVKSAASVVFAGAAGSSSSFFSNGGILGLGPSEGLAGVGFKALASGLQSFSAGTINSAIASVTYNDSNGFGFSAETFKQGFKSSSAGALSSMTGIFTSGVMDLGIEGFTGNVYQNGHNLSGLMGGLASQGINFAFGDDFVLNIFNAGIFSEKDFNAGVLELHLGRDGVNVALGSGGADVSIGNLWSAVKGFEAWGVNARLLLSREEDARKYAGQMRTLYSQIGANRDEYNNVLAGKTKYAESDNWYTESRYDETTGIKTVYLGTDALNDGSRFGLNVVFSHEAYRDGIVADESEQYGKTERAVIGHIKTSAEIINSYGYGSLGDQMTGEVLYMYAAMMTGDMGLMQSVINMYDSSGEYWKLLSNGNIAYDGKASLVDEDGNVIRSAASMKLSENAVESALIKILGFDPNDKNAASLVRSMMESSGLVHSNEADPNQWYWKGTHDAYIGEPGTFPVSRNVDLTGINMDRTITLSAIVSMYSMYGDLYGNNSSAVKSFINNTYGSPVGLLSYSDTFTARWLLSSVYSGEQIKKINENSALLDFYAKNGVNIAGMINGNVKRTQGFGDILKIVELITSKVPEAKYFDEVHTGIDFGPGGSSISVPGGYWEFYEGDDHRAYYQLYGSDLRMRVQHIDPDVIKKLVAGTIYSGGSTLLPYPTQSYGSGTGAHIHIDMTRNLPYNGSYTRQFVDPKTFKAGNQLEYKFNYYDADMVRLPSNSGNFKRY